jgi:hypothetical protein
MRLLDPDAGQPLVEETACGLQVGQLRHRACP